jgi:hypothetical protein
MGDPIYCMCIKIVFFVISEEISTLSFMRITSVFQETTENIRVTVMPFYLKKSDYVRHRSLFIYRKDFSIIHIFFKTWISCGIAILEPAKMITIIMKVHQHWLDIGY